MTTSFVLHREKFASSKILQVLHGNFTSKSIHNAIHQLCFNRKDHFDIYEIKQQSESYKLQYRTQYAIYGEITSMDKLRGFNSIYDAIVIAVDNKNISIVEYNKAYDSFAIVALYAIDYTLVSGKLFDIFPLQVISSIKYNCFAFVYNDTLMSFVPRKTPFNLANTNDKIPMTKYYDTLNGEKYFEPSVHYNFNVNFVYKIRKVFVARKNEEEFDYNNMIEPLNSNDSIVQLYLLYEDSCLSEQSSLLEYRKTKVNVAYCEFAMKSGKLNQFDILWENVDQYSFDCFVLEDNNTNNTNSNSNTNGKIIVLFSPYQIQLIPINNNREKKSYNFILNQIYLGVFLKEYLMKNQFLYQWDRKLMQKNIDLRGGGYLILTAQSFLFTTSQGEMYFFTWKPQSNEGQIDILPLQANGVLTNLGAPYNIICMPHPDLFFLSSFFSDGILIKYSTSGCEIVDSIINLSPIINFTPLNENKSTKFALTTGYDKAGRIHFIYDKFKFYELPKHFEEFIDVSFIKSIRFENEIYTRYLICGLTSGNSMMFEVNNRNFDNITDKIMYNNDSSIITADLMQIEHVKTMTFIVIVNASMIQIFDPFFKHLFSLKAKDLFAASANGTNNATSAPISKCRIGSTMLIVSNINNDIVIVHFYSKGSYNDSNKGTLYIEKKVNQAINVRYRDITSLIEANTILKYDVSSHEIPAMPYLVIYRTSQSIEVFNLHSLFTATPICLLVNSIINDLPEIISSNQNSTIDASDDYLRSRSDLSTRLSLEIEPNPALFSTTTPDEIFIDMLETKCIMCILFKNKTIVIYEVFYDEQMLKMKKVYFCYLQDIDFKKFFNLDSSNIFIKYNNIANCSGILINLSPHQRFIFEVNGKIVISQVDHSVYERNFSSFTEFSNEEIENGFLIFENGVLKHCFTPKNYSMTEYGLMKSNRLNRFPVNINHIPVYSNLSVAFCYLLIEKSICPIKLNEDNTSVSSTRFQYYLTFRTEDVNVGDQVEFGANEIVVESRVVELPCLDKMTTKKYFAVGVNVIDPKGEETLCKARLHLYDIEKGKFIKVYDQEIFRGTISMIHSIEKVLIISEGSRIFLYQFIPGINEMKKISVIDNKNLVSCSKIQSKFLITGDIIESVSWMMFTQPYNPSIYILGKDNSNYHSTAIDFWIDQDKSGCILCDDNKNGHVFLITKEDKSRQLMEVSDFYLGKVITELRMFPIQTLNVYYYSGDDGSIGYFIPVEEDTYQKLSLLCEYLFNHLPFTGGFNPKGFFNVKNFPFKRPKGRFIDMRMLMYYFYLPWTIQSNIAQNVCCERVTLIEYINSLLL